MRWVLGIVLSAPYHNQLVPLHDVCLVLSVVERGCPCLAVCRYRAYTTWHLLFYFSPLRTCVLSECRLSICFARVGGERRERLGVGVPASLRSDFFREEYALDYRLAKIAQEQVCVLRLGLCKKIFAPAAARARLDVR